MRPHGVYASILLAVFSCSHVTAKEPCVSYEVEKKPGKALVGHVNTTLVLSQPDCMSACNKLLHCYSVNLYRAGNGNNMCEINKSNREISPGSFVPKPGYEYNQITKMQTCDGRRCITAKGESIGPIAKWKLDGTDKDVRLLGSAIFEVEGGRKVLYLDGKTGSYAETPAVDFRTTSFTIAFWVKSAGPSADSRILYGDWAPIEVFRVSYAPNRAVLFQMRNSNGEDIKSQWGGLLTDGQWHHVAATWDRDTRYCTTFMDGKQHSTSQSSSQSYDVRAANGAVYDIGVQRNNLEKTFKGSLKDLMIFERALAEDEVDFMKDLPLEQVAWKLKLLSDHKESA